MKAFQTGAPGAPLIDKELPTPEPTGTEVLLKTVAAGVCHSDVHIHEAKFDLGEGKVMPAGFPGMTLGHEITGEVVALGPDAEGVAVGDRVVAFPWIGCGSCRQCERGEENLCGRAQNLGIARSGGFGDHVLVPHPRYLFDKGETADALSCTYACSGLTAYGALRKVGELPSGARIVIVGAGGVGMNAVQIARSAFDIDPIVCDIDEAKLEAAKAAGVEHVFNAADPESAKAIKTLTGGGAYAALDFVGSENSTQFALKTLEKGGKLVVVGLFGGSLKFPLPMIPILARTIQGSYVGSLAEMGELMELVRAGKIPAIPIEERPASAENATRTLQDLRDGKVAGRAVLMY
ncbi:MAG: alcohol dehydrogenase [Myxococcales bacterium]|nr:alcohol dehydrogenase [Myxococcales bacterium]